MCSPTCLEFGRQHLGATDIAGKAVLEVGALNVNGSLRDWVHAHQPHSYVGVDITPGNGVDQICDAEDLVAHFGRQQFDVVICTEVLEHVRHWRRVVSNLKNVLRPGGVLLMTTRSVHFGYHGYPNDFWRYSEDDCRRIFSDLAIDALMPDSDAPGIFLKAKKPAAFVACDLTDVRLFSILKARRCRDIGDIEASLLNRYWRARPRLIALLPCSAQRWLKPLVARRRDHAAAS